MYCLAFRRAALLVYDYLGSMRRAAKALKVSVASLCRWSKRLDPMPRRRGDSKISAAVEAVILSHLEQHPETSCPALGRIILDVFGLSVSRQLVHVIVKRLGYTHKRTRKRGVSASSEDRRHPFCQAFLAACNAAGGDVVAIDESGFDQRCKPVYGYAPRGQPAIVKVRASSDRRRFSLLMAISRTGQHQETLSEKAVKGPAFASFISSLPYASGTTLVLDNASIHKTQLVRQAAQGRGYVLLFTPPYTPEFNPIELVFGIIKNKFYKARYSPGFGDLRVCVENSVTLMATSTAIQGCFRHVEKIATAEIR